MVDRQHHVCGGDVGGEYKRRCPCAEEHCIHSGPQVCGCVDVAVGETVGDDIGVAVDVGVARVG